MGTTDGPQKPKLQQVKRLTHLYAQSRALPLILPLVFTVADVVLILGVIAFNHHILRPPRWSVPITVAVVLASTALLVTWCFLSGWLESKATARYAPKLYRREGEVVLRGERIPIRAWVLYLVTFLGPAILSLAEVLPIRWALTAALCSLGAFTFYAGRRSKESPLGIVFGGLLLIAAIATAAGLPTLFEGEWIHAYFLTLMTYVVGAGAITTFAVHLYNRWVLRRLKGIRF